MNTLSPYEYPAVCGPSAEDTPTLYERARETAARERWAECDPKMLLDQLILDLPDEVPLYPHEQRNMIPSTQPSDLELYFTGTIPADAYEDMLHYQPHTLTPEDSIACLRDKVRTKLFLQAIAEAIKDMEASPQETIEVCDAGTGAVPVMAMYAALCSDKVHCTALELNPRSAHIARSVVTNVGLQDRITIVETDATTYMPSQAIDLLVSETMHAGLTAEPMVQILTNLQPYVKPNGVTLPSSVDLKAALIPAAVFESPPAYTKIQQMPQRVINPAWQDVLRYVPGQPLEAIAFSLDITGLPDGRYYVAVTDDVAIGPRTLRPCQSLLTMPQYIFNSATGTRVFDLRTGTSQGDQALEVYYEPGSTLSAVSAILR